MRWTTKTTTALVVVLTSSLGFVALANAKGHRDAVSFAELDTNGDGSLTQDEITARAKMRFDEVDTNGDGQLSSEEIAARADERMAKRVERMISRRDSNDDGALSFEEMQGDRKGRGFSRLDADGDGVVSEDEFAEMQEKRSKRKGDRKNRGDKDTSDPSE
ncbi:MAG: EF-hand domain-containing protein [Pseudomonadota bacterium]